MSWDKNTINHSTIKTLAEELKANGVECEVREIGKVRGLGLNDDCYPDNDGAPFYTLYALYIDGKQKYRDQMQRSTDCDFNDYLVTNKTEGELPLEIYIDEDDVE